MATKQKQQRSKVPAGMRQVQTGGLPPFHDFSKHRELDGKVVAVRKFKDRWGNKKRSMDIADSDGVLCSVTESAALRGLFNQAKIGKRVVIRFLGSKKIKGRKNPMKQFECYTQ